MHLLRISSLSEEQILEIFALARLLKANPHNPVLKGKTFVLFFPAASIRTRITFEKGIKDLGGECILFPPETLDKQEESRDVMGYLENWADGVVIRHPNLVKLQDLTSYASIPVINAMTSDHHPCEILSDLFSIAELRDDYRELAYTYVGPVNNISRSWMEAAGVLDLNLTHVCTHGNAFPEAHPHYRFTTELETALAASDIVLTDSLPKSFLNHDYIRKYQITLERMKLTNPEALLNPCPPFYRNEEVSRDVLETDYFVGYTFKKNLLYIQQAVLIYCLGLTI